MYNKLMSMTNSTKQFIGKHSPAILTGIGITGMVTSTVLAVKATPKAIKILEKEETKKGSELEIQEKVKMVWKEYMPSMSVGVISILCLISANRISGKRQAALATAYALSERTFTRYKDKVVETLGERKEKKIKEEISQDEVNEKKPSSTQIILTTKGNTLCFDSITGRYFKSDLDSIRKAVNELNREMINDNYISLNRLYSKIGLDSVKDGDRLGWNLDDGLIDLSYDTCLAEDEPCVVINYSRSPKYNFDRMF